MLQLAYVMCLTIILGVWISCLVPCAVELRDDSEGGVGSIEEEMIRRGLLMATSPRAEAVRSYQ